MFPKMPNLLVSFCFCLHVLGLFSAIAFLNVEEPKASMLQYWILHKTHARKSLFNCECVHNNSFCHIRAVNFLVCSAIFWKESMWLVGIVRLIICLFGWLMANSYPRCLLILHSANQWHFRKCAVVVHLLDVGSLIWCRSTLTNTRTYQINFET